jgi:hypothetical protein
MENIKILRLTTYEDNGIGFILQDDKTPPFEVDFYKYLGKDFIIQQNTPIGMTIRNTHLNEKIPKYILIKL